MADQNTADDPAATLAKYVQAVAPDDQQHAAQCSAEAQVLVQRLVGEGNPHKVPDEVVARCVLEVGADLYYRKRTRHGIAAFDGIDVAPIRIARDPLSAARPLLAAFIPIGIA